MRGIVAQLFSLQGNVSRRSYVSWGAGLMALKYLLDTTLIYAATKHWLSPYEFLIPLLSMRDELLKASSTNLLALLGVLSLPFLWVGSVLSLRRAEDAGVPPGYAVFFAFPLLNWALMLWLSLLPSRATPPATFELAARSFWRSALLGVATGTLITLAMVGLSALLLHDYGQVLFFATPFVLGTSTGYVFNRGGRQPQSRTLAVSAAAILISAGALLLFALEGVVCLVMAAPLALFAAALGALVGRQLATRPRTAAASMLPGLLGMPLGLGIESLAADHTELREVVSEVIIDAPPAVVWRYVLAFPPLPTPTEPWFRLGIAYPTKASISEPPGVGAVRRCEFSTGTFVEPIRVFEPPTRLGFDVTSQPPPMSELSPYGAFTPPHFAIGMRSRRGEFRLTALPGGRTRLAGSTWYTLGLEPARYWALWTDVIIHGIHGRVLEHVQRCAEQGCRGQRPNLPHLNLRPDIGRPH
jgi:hypothetical protein